MTIAGAGGEVAVQVEAWNPASPTRETVRGFVESDGYVSIEPEHFSTNAAAGANRWSRVAGYGRTLSGMRAESPVDVSATPGKDAPALEYELYLFTAGEVTVTTITGPTLNFIPGRDVRFAVSFDDEKPKIVTLVPQAYKAQNGNRAWEKSVGDNAHVVTSKHTLSRPGSHTLKVWMVDPGVVVQKLVIDTGGLRPSYLGPPESFRGGAEAAVRTAP